MIVSLSVQSSEYHHLDFSNEDMQVQRVKVMSVLQSPVGSSVFLFKNLFREGIILILFSRHCIFLSEYVLTIQS